MENRPPLRVEADPERVKAIMNAMLKAGNLRCRQLDGTLVDSCTSVLHLAEAAFTTLLNSCDPESVDYNRVSIQSSILELFHKFDGPENNRRPT